MASVIGGTTGKCGHGQQDLGTGNLQMPTRSPGSDAQPGSSDDYSKDDRSVSGQFSQRFILLQEASRKAENCGIHPSSD